MTCQYVQMFGVCLEPDGCELIHSTMSKDSNEFLPSLTTHSKSFNPNLNTESVAFDPASMQIHQSYDD